MNIEEEEGVKIVIPGERIAHIEDARAGPGVDTRGSYLVAIVSGIVRRHDGVVHVEPAQKIRARMVLPAVGDIVTARVVRVQARQAVVDIQCVGSVPLDEPFQGIVRAQDVRSSDTARVEVYKCFRPGDVIRAAVLAQGDARSYILTTARPEFGVVFAHSAAGYTMVPASWTTMQCPRTKLIEPRKVAAPISSSSSSKSMPSVPTSVSIKQES